MNSFCIPFAIGALAFVAGVLATLALGAFAVASAMLLIIELNQPYTGFFRMSPAALVETLDAMKQ